MSALNKPHPPHSFFYPLQSSPALLVAFAAGRRPPSLRRWSSPLQTQRSSSSKSTDGGRSRVRTAREADRTRPATVELQPQRGAVGGPLSGRRASSPAAAVVEQPLPPGASASSTSPSAASADPGSARAIEHDGRAEATGSGEEQGRRRRNGAAAAAVREEQGARWPDPARAAVATGGETCAGVDGRRRRAVRPMKTMRRRCGHLPSAAIFPGGPPSLAGQAGESGGEAPSPPQSWGLVAEELPGGGAPSPDGDGEVVRRGKAELLWISSACSRLATTATRCRWRSSLSRRRRGARARSCWELRHRDTWWALAEPPRSLWI
jgi:hypothetical protein